MIGWLHVLHAIVVLVKSPTALQNAFVTMAGTYLTAEDITAMVTDLAKFVMGELNVFAKMDGQVRGCDHNKSVASICEKRSCQRKFQSLDLEKMIVLTVFSGM